MDVSGGTVTITESKAAKTGGSGGMGRFLGTRTGGQGMPPARTGTQSVRGSAVWGEGSSSKLERFAGRCDPSCNVASPILKTYVYLGFPLVHLFDRAALATAVFSIEG